MNNAQEMIVRLKLPAKLADNITSTIQRTFNRKVLQIEHEEFLS